MAEELDLDRLHFTLRCTVAVDPVVKVYLPKEEVQDFIQDVFDRGARHGSFNVDPLHLCEWWYAPETQPGSTTPRQAPGTSDPDSSRC